ncbi:hypothetical protein [Caldisericum sp.]|uniref:hypothetical protein n=1 Tax=Caldisericum sp. TaxID=2499687 RepID=UPI003D15211E
MHDNYMTKIMKVDLYGRTNLGSKVVYFCRGISPPKLLYLCDKDGKMAFIDIHGETFLTIINTLGPPVKQIVKNE